MTKKELLDIAIDYLKTEAGKKALGIGLDVNQLVSLTKTATNKEEKQKIKEELKSYVPVIEKFEIEGRLYDKISSKPIEGAKIEPLIALGKKNIYG